MTEPRRRHNRGGPDGRAASPGRAEGATGAARATDDEVRGNGGATRTSHGHTDAGATGGEGPPERRTEAGASSQDDPTEHHAETRAPHQDDPTEHHATRPTGQEDPAEHHADAEATGQDDPAEHRADAEATGRGGAAAGRAEGGGDWGRLVRRYVTPRSHLRSGGRYAELGSGRFLRFEGAVRRRFLRRMLVDAASITDADLRSLLSSGWRPQLVAAWLIGVSRRASYRSRLENLLLGDEEAYAEGDLCFALARLGAEEDAEILAAYLNRTLPRTDLRHARPTALGALLRLDSHLGTAYAAPFTAPDGPYERWLRATIHESERHTHSPAEEHARMNELCDFADGWSLPVQRHCPAPSICRPDHADCRIGAHAPRPRRDPNGRH